MSETHAAVMGALAEADAAANAAAVSADSWTWTAQKSDQAVVVDEHGYALVYNEGTVGDQMAAHIAAYDPTTVRALIAARRRIVERHEPAFDAPDACCAMGCIDKSKPDTQQWPCADYRDAAADLLPKADA